MSIGAVPVKGDILSDGLNTHGYLQAAPVGTFIFADGNVTRQDMAICRDGIEETLQRMPVEVQSIVLNFDQSDPRGMADSKRVVLRCDVAKEERLRVLIHEIGHVAYLNADLNVRGEYKSLWENSLEDADFVSGYAQENEMEDFAESFLAFVDFGQSFREAAAENSVLARKYAFIEEYFLRDRVYQGKSADLRGTRRIFDLTKAVGGN